MIRLHVMFLALVTVSPALAQEWTRLPPLPDRNGVAGAFAGMSGGSLLVAGGANFPDKKPWEGGTKVWYDRIFIFNEKEQAWKVVGKLPRPLAYGVSVTHGGGVVCVGGSNADGLSRDAFRLTLHDGNIVTTPLPPLPRPLANACGALVGDTLYIAGGQETPDAREASNAVLALDLHAAEPRWRAIARCPGEGRILATASSCDGAFWVAGGASLAVGADGKVARHYLKDAYRYDPAAGWKQVADLPHPAAAAPSPAPADASGFYILGGDDGAQIGVAPDQHRGFLKKVIHFDLKSGKWRDAGDLPAATVTCPVVHEGDVWLIVSGEVRPGVRSPEVWRWTPRQGK